MLGLPDEVQGILGLGLADFVKQQDVDQQDLKLGNKYIDFLRMSGAISEKLFSTHLEGAGGNSFIDFGPEVWENMSSYEDQTSINMDGGYFWNIRPKGIRFGVEQDQLEFYLEESNYMILSSSTAFNFVPKSLADDFYYNLFSKYRIPYSV